MQDDLFRLRCAPNIGLQRTPACGLAAEAGSFGGRKVTFSPVWLSAILVAALAGRESSATSLFPVQLRETKSVSVNLFIGPELNLSKAEMQLQVVDILEDVGISVVPYGERLIEIFVDTDRLSTHGSTAVCGSLRLTTEVVLKDDMSLNLRDHWATIWEGSGLNVVSCEQSPEEARRLILELITNLADETTTVWNVFGRP